MHAGLQLSHDFKELPANAQAWQNFLIGGIDQQWMSCDESNNYRPQCQKIV
jgi:hypothetical protein